MDTKLAIRQIRLNEWVGIIKDCKASGLKVNEYCQQHNLSRDAYYYWLRKVKEAALIQAGFVPLVKTAPPSEVSDFQAQMVIRIRETELLVNQATPPELISRVIGILCHA